MTNEFKDSWLEDLRQCQQLEESDLKKLCEIVSFGYKVNTND
jgi:hypothetical protein